MQLMELFIDVLIRADEALLGLDRIDDKAMQAAGGMDQAGDAATGMGKKLLKTAAIMGVVYKVGRQMVEGAIDIENGMIGVSKTTGLAGAELETLRQGYRKLAKEPSVNASINELFELGEIAGTAGIKSTEQILEFSEVLAKLNSASGGKLQGEAGAKAILNILDASEEGIESISNLASSVTFLGNEFRVNEAEIASSATRVSNALRPYGARSADIVGLATAFAELRLSPELAQTAISKTLSSISLSIADGGDDLQKFQKITGLSRAEMERLLKTDGTALFTAFTSGLNRMSNAGQNVDSVLKGVGLESQRTGDTLKGLAVRSDRLNTILAASSEAYQKNTALNEEAGAASKSFTARMTALGNSIAFLGDTLSQSGGVLDSLGGLALLFAGAVDAVSSFIGWLDPLFVQLAIAPGLLALVATALWPVIAATWAWTAALLANPVVWIFIAIGVAIFLVVKAFQFLFKGIKFLINNWRELGARLINNPIFALHRFAFRMVRKFIQAFLPLDRIKGMFVSLMSFIWSVIQSSPLFRFAAMIASIVPKVGRAFASMYGAAKAFFFDRIQRRIEQVTRAVNFIRGLFQNAERALDDRIASKQIALASGAGLANVSGVNELIGSTSTQTTSTVTSTSTAVDNRTQVDQILVQPLPGQDPTEIAAEISDRLERTDRRVNSEATN